MKIGPAMTAAVLALVASAPAIAQKQYEYTYCIATTSRDGVVHYIFSAPYPETPETLPGESIDDSMMRVARLHTQASREFGEYRDKQDGFRNSWSKTDCTQPGTFKPKPGATPEQAKKNALEVMKYMTEANGKAGPIVTDFVPSWAKDQMKPGK